jgi:hypothetical protein
VIPSNVGACARRQDGDLLLDLLYIIFARLEIDLDERKSVNWNALVDKIHSRTHMLDRNNFPGRLVNRLVDSTKTSAYATNGQRK